MGSRRRRASHLEHTRGACEGDSRFRRSSEVPRAARLGRPWLCSAAVCPLGRSGKGALGSAGAGTQAPEPQPTFPKAGSPAHVIVVKKGKKPLPSLACRLPRFPARPVGSLLTPGLLTCAASRSPGRREPQVFWGRRGT